MRIIRFCYYFKVKHKHKLLRNMTAVTAQVEKMLLKNGLFCKTVDMLHATRLNTAEEL